MVDTVTSKTLDDKTFEASFLFTNLSDGTGESTVQKVDASTLLGAADDGTDRLEITDILWTISGGGGVSIIYDGSGNETAFICAGSGSLLGRSPSASLDVALPNGATSPTGDILFTTHGFSNGDTYSIVLKVKKVAGYTGT